MTRRRRRRRENNINVVVVVVVVEGNTTNCQIPGVGFFTSNIVTLDNTIFPEVTKLPRGFYI